RVPPLDDVQADVLRTAFGTLPDAAANDGMVPTRSQPWGEVIAAVRADHLDVVGHFGDPAHDPPHIDWITTGSGFTPERLGALWAPGGDFMLGARASGIPESRSAASCRAATPAGCGAPRPAPARAGHAGHPGLRSSDRASVPPLRVGGSPACDRGSPPDVRSP